MADYRVFLLSPAYCGGRRAATLLRPGSQMPLARRLAEGRMSLGEAFSFMSGLYFRGKLAYAQKFGGPVFVITPTRGLMSPDSQVTGEMLQEFATVDVDAGDRRYRRPLDRDLRRLNGAISPTTPIVLLGSIATGKYVDALRAVFGERLCFPAAFVGRGDMSRGGLMLRSVDAEVELDYIALTAAVARHGERPPKLEPLNRVSRFPPPLAPVPGELRRDHAVAARGVSKRAAKAGQSSRVPKF